jgi:hypothetical protein
MLRRPCNNITMIKFIKELIKKWSRIEEQDPHLVLYEEVKPKHCIEHTRYKKSCKACQEITN